MAIIKVTPIGAESFILTGTLTKKDVNGEAIYYINGESFPAEIVEVVSE